MEEQVFAPVVTRLPWAHVQNIQKSHVWQIFKLLQILVALHLFVNQEEILDPRPHANVDWTLCHNKDLKMTITRLTHIYLKPEKRA